MCPPEHLFVKSQHSPPSLFGIEVILERLAWDEHEGHFDYLIHFNNVAAAEREVTVSGYCIPQR